MVKIEVDKGEFKKFELHGDPVELLAEVCCIIRKAHNVFSKADEDAGDLFRSCIEGVVKDGILFMSQEDLRKTAKEVTEEKEKVEEIIEGLEQLAKKIEEL